MPSTKTLIAAVATAMLASTAMAAPAPAAAPAPVAEAPASVVAPHADAAPVAGNAPLSTSNPALRARAQLGKRNSVNDCGDSTFVNQSSEGSPLISDCLQIAANIAGGGTWTTYEGADINPRQIVSYGTCVMDVKGNTPNDGSFNVGNQDIIDLINSAVDMFAFDGKVGAIGNMNCQGWLSFSEAYTSNVDWRLYHT